MGAIVRSLTTLEVEFVCYICISSQAFAYGSVEVKIGLDFLMILLAPRGLTQTFCLVCVGTYNNTRTATPTPSGFSPITYIKRISYKKTK